jgi:hypothetical protein
MDLENIYEDGDCFDLDDELKPIGRVKKTPFCLRKRIYNYTVFTIFLLGTCIILYYTFTTINIIQTNR